VVSSHADVAVGLSRLKEEVKKRQVRRRRRRREEE